LKSPTIKEYLDVEAKANRLLKKEEV